jgi:methylated-DNA-[protein]-cysteine S-methyltransferase
MTYYTLVPSPIGELLLTSDGEALTRLYMSPFKLGENWIRDESVAPLPEARRQLDAYFAGELKEFALPLRSDGSPFQERVWLALRNIPYATTISYGELATRIGQPSAARAVGLANGQNPISIVVPCHRVIGANGSLTGYGGGLERKKVLLDLEGGKAQAALEL